MKRLRGAWEPPRERQKQEEEHGWGHSKLKTPPAWSHRAEGASAVLPAGRSFGEHIAMGPQHWALPRNQSRGTTCSAGATRALLCPFLPARGIQNTARLQMRLCPDCPSQTWRSHEPQHSPKEGELQVPEAVPGRCPSCRPVQAEAYRVWIVVVDTDGAEL